MFVQGKDGIVANRMGSPPYGLRGWKIKQARDKKITLLFLTPNPLTLVIIHFLANLLR